MSKLDYGFSEGFCAINCRYRPTPESSDGAGEDTLLLLMGVRVTAVLV